MGRLGIRPTGRERFSGEEEIIVSKTDTRGVITYANGVFCRVAGYTGAELPGAPHSIIRHPDMPRAVFKLRWDTIDAGREIFAYVVNLARTGDHYRVYAHLTPTLGPDGSIVGHHSSRRVPTRVAIEAVRPVYAQLLAEEQQDGHTQDAIAASTRMLEATLAAAGVGYEQFVWSLDPEAAR
jgi:PAS domain S-box-containing protein